MLTSFASAGSLEGLESIVAGLLAASTRPCCVVEMKLVVLPCCRVRRRCALDDLPGRVDGSLQILSRVDPITEIAKNVAALACEDVVRYSSRVR